MRKLYYSEASPFARKIRILLAEKGLEYEADVLNGGLRPIDVFKQHNPALQVPTLYDRGGVLWGSNLIAQYLYAAYPESPLIAAKPPLAPAIARPDKYWDDMLTITTIESLADSIANYRLVTGGNTELKIAYLDRQLARVASCLDWLEPRCTSEGFWPGTFSVMDINLICPLLFGEARKIFDFRTGRWPKIVAMVDQSQARPSVTATKVVLTGR